tara:strand:- start:365 stop:532 length:168 start_codon:yes stop_codon:yes gene_type:complete
MMEIQFHYVQAGLTQLLLVPVVLLVVLQKELMVATQLVFVKQLLVVAAVEVDVEV